MAKAEVKQKGFFDKAMDFIEKIGNAMPDPVSLFIILAIVVVILSAVLGSMGYGAVHPGTGKTIQVVNLLTKDGFRDMYSKAVANYSNFAPLGMVLVCIIGAAVAEKSGFLVTMMKHVMATPNRGWLPLPLFLWQLTLTLRAMPALSLCRRWLPLFIWAWGAAGFGHDCSLCRCSGRF